MDGLLIDSEPFWKIAEKDAFSSVGLELSQEDMNKTMGTRIDEVVGYWFHERPWKGASQKDIEAAIVDRVMELVKSEGKTRAGAIDTLDFFENKGLPMAVASSSSMEIINTVVDALDIRHYFVELFSAEHESHGKPHPGVFISTANHLQAKPQQCLVFEDSPSGVLAAKAAKMKCIAIPENNFISHPFVLAADRVLGSLEEFDQSIFDEISS